MSKSIYDFVKEHSLEEFINEDNIGDFQLKKYDAGSFILMSGEKKEKIFLFVQGVIKVTLFSDDGKELLLELMKPFDILGDIEYVLGNNNTLNVQVIEESICIEVKKDIIEKNQLLYKLMSKTLAGKLLRNSRKILDNQLFSTKDLVLKFIQENEPYVRNSLRYNEMAKLLGLSERQLRRVLKELEDDRYIKKNGKKLYLL